MPLRVLNQDWKDYDNRKIKDQGGEFIPKTGHNGS